MNMNQQTTLLSLAAASIVVTMLVFPNLNPVKQAQEREAHMISQIPKAALPVVTPPAPQRVAQSEKWIVVLVSWETRAPIDHRFDSYDECRLYMVKIALPMIQDQPDVYAKCERVS